MSLRPGTRLGPYQIVGTLGAGGMGEVYRARDAKLGRDVALKTLPETFVGDAERLARFRREAQVASSLSHPHIVTVHDIGEYGDRQCLVTELVDGGTLKEWCKEPRPWRQVVDLVSGIADGLAAAHAAGVLHRDIKPANILVAKNGYAKLADFGLAKLADVDASEPDITRSVAAEHTQPGTVLGTLAYMSPEQVSGKPLDARSDIFSFGVVLYELLAGRRPFAGTTDRELIQSILHDSPPSLSDDVPPVLQNVVEKALEKDPSQRYHTTRDLAIDLRRLSRTKSDAVRRVPVDPLLETPRQRVWAWVAGVALLAFGVGAAVGRSLLTEPAAAGSANVQLQRITDFVGMEEHAAVSPDGKAVAFIAPVNGRRQVWVRLLAGGAPLQVTRDDADHEYPRWAPDSSSLIYFSGAAKEGDPGTLFEVSALGTTPPRRIGSSASEGDVSHDGRRIVTFRTQNNGTALTIFQRDGSGSALVKPLPALAQYFSPRWSPDDRSVAFVGAVEIGFNRTAYVMDVPDGEPQAVARAGNIQGIAWLPDGSGLVYASSAGSTMAYPPIFNLRTVARNGGPERQLTFGDVSYVQPDIVTRSKLFASRVRMQSDIWRFPVTGLPADNVKNGVRITRQTGQVQTPSASPDGTEIVYLSDSGGHVNVWVSKVDGSGTRQITFERDPTVVIGIPIWSPAGDRIVILVNRSSTNGEWLINPDGSGLRELVPNGAGASWSRDGRWLYYFKSTAAGQANTCVEKIPADGGSAAPVRCEAANMALAADGSLFFSPQVSRQGEILKAQTEDGPAQPFAYVAQSRIPLVPQGFVLSPDDRLIAMPLRDAGTTNIWVIPTDGGPARPLTDFGQRPILIARQVSWSPDGRSIYAAVVETDADIVLLDGMLP